ncbi:MAG: energy transducer TonB [Gammaproteobacteria bacterium]|nr:energy transducer TonB [Gammaproteobacteria bacterium]NNL50709.1 hypothetical protein [Woeseiaceae bacterium]
MALSIRNGVSSVALLTALLANVSLCHAQTLDHELSNLGKALVIDQAPPDYPGHAVRNGQEGWVRMHFVVTPDGRAIDPIIIDSSGGAGFEGKLARCCRVGVSTLQAPTPSFPTIS